MNTNKVSARTDAGNEMQLDPETGVPREFWECMEEVFGDPDAFENKLRLLTREKFVLYFLIYQQLIADLVEELMMICSEDTATDISEGLVALGRKAYLTCERLNVGRLIETAGFDSMLEEIRDRVPEIYKNEIHPDGIIDRFGEPSIRWGTNNNYPCFLL